MFNFKWLLLVVCTLIISSIYASDDTNIYPHPVITLIDSAQQTIYLSNDTVWQIRNDPMLEPHPWQNESYLIERNSWRLGMWKEGDSVYLVNGSYHNYPYWTIINDNITNRYNRVLKVELINQNLPKITKISDDARNLQLTDESEWRVSWMGSFLTYQSWKVGDRILIYKINDKILGNTHAMWNLDRSSYNRIPQVNVSLEKPPK